MPLKNKKLLVFFLSSMDLRRISSENTPFINQLLNKYSYIKLNTFPEVDHDPTILTGLYPHEHEMCQLEINPENKFIKEDILDRLPDFITTTFQCLIHLFKGNYNLAAMPRWRRKRFKFKKIRYSKRNVKNFLRLNKSDTIFNIIGENFCNYVYVRNIKELNQSLYNLFQKEYKLEFIEVHTLDTLQHWNLDNNDRIAIYYRQFDSYIEKFYSACTDKGFTFMFLSEHGMEPVKGSIDIIGKLKSLEIPRAEYSYFIEVPKARFFFHSDRSRKEILNLLNSLNKGKVFSYKDLHKYNVNFTDSKQGEYYLIADPGYIFFPHDYYHPVANLYLAMTDGLQRRRLISNKYRGYHGYLPENDSERGFMIVADEDIQFVSNEASIVDIAPTVLGLLSIEKPADLPGKILFK